MDNNNDYNDYIDKTKNEMELQIYKPIIISFDANNILETVEGKVVFYSCSRYERLCHILNGLIDYSSIASSIYEFIDYSPLLTNESLFYQEDLKSYQVGILFRVINININIYMDSIKEILFEVLDNIENCDVPNIINIIQEYIPYNGLASYFLDLNHHHLNDDDFIWELEINGTYKSSGDLFVRYINDISSKYDNINNINILLNFNEEEIIDSVYLVFKECYSKNNIKWRSKEPLEINKSIEIVELQKIRLNNILNNNDLE
jgi:hypothetical protein